MLRTLIPSEEPQGQGDGALSFLSFVDCTVPCSVGGHGARLLGTSDVIAIAGPSCSYPRTLEQTTAPFYSLRTSAGELTTTLFLLFETGFTYQDDLELLTSLSPPPTSGITHVHHYVQFCGAQDGPQGPVSVK